MSIDEWAEGVAASLPPLSPAEAAAIGRTAAEIDARRWNSCTWCQRGIHTPDHPHVTGNRHHKGNPKATINYIRQSAADRKRPPPDLDAYIKRLTDSAPVLTAEQIEQLRTLVQSPKN